MGNGSLSKSEELKVYSFSCNSISRYSRNKFVFQGWSDTTHRRWWVIVFAKTEDREMISRKSVSTFDDWSIKLQPYLLCDRFSLICPDSFTSKMWNHSITGNVQITAIVYNIRLMNVNSIYPRAN